MGTAELHPFLQPASSLTQLQAQQLTDLAAPPAPPQVDCVFCLEGLLAVPMAGH